MSNEHRYGYSLPKDFDQHWHNAQKNLSMIIIHDDNGLKKSKEEKRDCKATGRVIVNDNFKIK